MNSCHEEGVRDRNRAGIDCRSRVQVAQDRKSDWAQAEDPPLG
eukprot:gene1939-biopygen11192